MLIATIKNDRVFCNKTVIFRLFHCEFHCLFIVNKSFLTSLKSINELFIKRYSLYF